MAGASGVEVCRICLDTESKLYLLSEYNLEEAYEKITGLSLYHGITLAPTLCVECAHRLINCNSFREKSLRAHTLLLGLIEDHEFLTIQNIKTVNRVNNELTSNLVNKIFKPEHCDYYFEENYDDEKNVEIEKITHTSTDKVEVKLEKSDDVVFILKPKEEAINNNTETVKYGNVEYVNEDIDFNDDVDNDVDIFNDIVDKKDDVSNPNELSKVYNVEIIKDRDGMQITVDNKEDSINITSNKNDPLKVKKNTKTKNTKNTKITKTNKVTKSRKNTKTDKSVSSKKEKKPAKTPTDSKAKPVSGTYLKLFKVTALTVEEQLADVKKRQETDNYKKSQYKCTMCYKGFITKNSHSRHMAKHSNKCGEVPCPICSMYFVNRERLCNHMRRCHYKRYSCTSCNYVTKQRRSAALHERWHNGTKYKCPKCDDEFNTVSAYMSHLRINHPTNSICILCGYSFVSEKGIADHIRAKHRFESLENPQGPECVQCNVRFASEAAYEQHVKVSPKHNTEGSRIRNAPAVARERKEAASTDSITCEQCGLEVKDFKSYTWHFRKVHPDKNRTLFSRSQTTCLCEQCGRVFQNKALLDYHKAVHAGQRLLQCDFCAKRFNFKSQLSFHMKRHSDNRRMYECPICKKNFTSTSSRDRHVFIHNGKAFHCDVCGKAFSNIYDRRTHVLHVHLKKPWPKRNQAERGKASHTKLKEEASALQDEGNSSLQMWQ